MDQQDGIYSAKPWTRNVPDVQRPSSSYEDQTTGAALASQMAMTPEEIRDIKPPIPLNPFPPRFGYRVEALGIDDMIDINDIYRRYDFTGKQSGMGSTSMPTLGTM